MGNGFPRLEDARLLTGRGTFVDDVVIPGTLHAAFVRSPVARGKIRSIDTSGAISLPGVQAILRGEDLAPLDLKLKSGHVTPMAGERIVPALATGEVLYVGDPVAIVIADDRYIAEDAAGLVVVDYEEETPVVTMADARTGARVHPDVEGNICSTMQIPADFGDVFETAAHVVSETIRHQRIAHSPMETRGILAALRGEQLLVHMATQGTHSIARDLIGILGRPDLDIRVISKDVGGAFGLKSRPWREEIAVIGAALLLGRPVKWIEDRYENLTTANQAREQEYRIKVAFDAEGLLLASHFEGEVNNGVYPHYPDSGAAAAIFLWAPYKIPRYGFRSDGLFTNTVGIAAYRGPWAMESLARETAIDIAARKMGIEPVELRRRNLVKAADLPHTTTIGMVLEDVTPSECLDQLLTKVDLAAFRKEQAEARKQGRYLGIGIATYVEPTAMTSHAPFASEIATVRIGPTGRVTAGLGTHSQGQGTQTTMAQIIADTLGVRIEEVTIVEDDSSATGYGGGAGGSRQAVAGGGAAMGASQMLLAKVKQVAAHLLNASPEAVRVEDGQVHVEGAPEMTRSLSEIAAVAYNEPKRLPEGMEAGLEINYRHQSPPVTFASAAHACVVEVCTETGRVNILRWVASEDCGVVIHPAVVEGQIAGGLAQAIGMVLLEDMPFDAQGNPAAATFKDYLLPSITDVPEIEFTHIVTPAKGLGGFRGVGEGGAIIGPPALINAIYDALSPFDVTCLDLPLSPSRLLDAIEKGSR
ncbi:xanthine dehydrogenase family protein molybdopterin-binding subunit [Novosphingobium sp. G106]|uniref:xanthine dehydrogenase family protein molybdopterin-binding subunit n=1 Tax=Novosphingobium sp. G106 TaxID=2849500 RepID=UPI0020C2F6D1|nr:xanthine dehydrogenase family protein molybdopterin-binding subunit [Novosphingobium sp. G106]